MPRVHGRTGRLQDVGGRECQEHILERRFTWIECRELCSRQF